MATKKRLTKKKRQKKSADQQVGRPTKFDQTIPERAYQLCLLGMTDAELAQELNVSERTVNDWKRRHPKFLEAVRKGKAEADADVVHALYLRARGYTHPEEKVFCTDGKVTRVDTTKHYPPDTAAASLWLRNRQADRWRDEKKVTVERPLSEYTYQELQELANRLTAERDQLLGIDSALDDRDE